MAVVNPQGITPTDLTGYRELFQTRFQAAFGPDLALEPETVQGEIIGIMALSATEADEALVAVAQGMSVGRGVGTQLDDLGSLLAINREVAVKSTVSATVAGVVSSLVPAGAIVKTTAGDEFALLADVLIPLAGSVTGEFEAVEAGPVEAPAGTLTALVTLVPGWETVTNPADATVGKLAEVDVDYRARYGDVTGRLAVAPADALRAAIVEAGAEKVRVEENNTSAEVTRQTLVIPSHSVMCIIGGGQASAIAAAILGAKGLGVGMAGATTQDGAKFQAVSEVEIKVTVDISITNQFPADGLVSIKNNLVVYAVAEFGIGEGVDEKRLLSPVNAVMGHQVNTLAVTLIGGGALPAEPALNVIYTLGIAGVVLTVS